MQVRSEPFLRGALLTFLLLTGCRHWEKEQLEKRLMSYKPKRVEVHQQYQIRSPDTVEIVVPGSPEWSGTFQVSIDGKIRIGGREPLLVEGMTVGELTTLVSQRASIPTGQIRVTVTKYSSQKLFVHGEIKGSTRAVPYQGPETVVMLLQRMGGVTTGAISSDIQVVRARIADGDVPEVYHVNLKEVLIEGKVKEDPPLRPFDQIYVKQTRRAGIEKCLPHWLRPFYAKICGLKHPYGDIISPRLPLGERRRARRR